MTSLAIILGALIIGLMMPPSVASVAAAIREHTEWLKLQRRLDEERQERGARHVR